MHQVPILRCTAYAIATCIIEKVLTCYNFMYRDYYKTYIYIYYFIKVLYSSQNFQKSSQYKILLKLKFSKVLKKVPIIIIENQLVKLTKVN